MCSSVKATKTQLLMVENRSQNVVEKERTKRMP
jgi:uncharacterized membrane protein